jgi:hypothetical protein
VRDEETTSASHSLACPVLVFFPELGTLNSNL